MLMHDCQAEKLILDHQSCLLDVMVPATLFLCLFVVDNKTYHHGIACSQKSNSSVKTLQPNG